MAMFSQLQGITGKKKRSRYRDIIEQEAARLPEMQRQKEQKQYQDQLYGLEQQRMGLERGRFKHEKGLSEEAARLARERFKDQKKQARRSDIIGGLGLASNLLSGTAASGGQSWGMEPVASGAKKVYGAGKDALGGLWSGAKNIFSGLFSLG